MSDWESVWRGLESATARLLGEGEPVSDENGVTDGEYLVDELAAQRWKRSEKERVAATFPDAEVGPDRRETLD